MNRRRRLSHTQSLVLVILIWFIHSLFVLKATIRFYQPTTLTNVNVQSQQNQNQNQNQNNAHNNNIQLQLLKKQSRKPRLKRLPQHDNKNYHHEPTSPSSYKELKLSVNCSNWDESASCHKLWRGSPSTSIHENDDTKLLPKTNIQVIVTVTVVISYCNSIDDDINQFINYINNNEKEKQHLEQIKIKDVIILRRCPEPEISLEEYDNDNSYYNNYHQNEIEIFPDNAIVIPMVEERLNPHTSFARWLSNYKYIPNENENEDEENHYILFLSSTSIMQQIERCRTISEVINAANQYGFSCILKPLKLTHSIYHDTAILRTFESLEQQQLQLQLVQDSPNDDEYDSIVSISNKRNFGNWLDEMNILMTNERITPACYGCSFAIKAIDIPSKRNVLLAITQDLQKQNSTSTEVAEYTERSWAKIFSYTLPKNVELGMINHTNDVKIESCCYTGLLSTNYTKPVSPLWKGDTAQHHVNISKLGITLVLSFCDEDISWMKEFINSDHVRIEKAIILSKCNYYIQEMLPFDTTSNNVTVIELPNVGRCDHSYAHYMGQIMEESEANDNHIVLFMKASRNLHQPDSNARSLKDMIRIAYYNGLGCGIELLSMYSAYYDSSELGSFEKKTYFGNDVSSIYDNFADWLDKLGIEFTTSLVPVCYGGFFAVKASRIIGRRDIWRKIELSLSRGDNIEEGHFAERTWAALLSNPLSPSQIEELKRNSTGTTPTYNIHYVGSLSNIEF